MTITAASALLALAVASPAPSYDRLVRTARAHLEMGSLERAHELASSAAAASPERPEAHAILGSIFASRNELDEAIAAYERARARKSRDRRLFLELTSAYDITRRYDDAVAVYRAWLEEHQGDAEFLKELGLTLLIQNKPKEAVVSLRRAAKARPDDLELQQDLGYALLLDRDLDAAATTLAAVLAKDAKRPRALQLLAQVRALAGRLDEAVALLDRALDLEPNDPRARHMRARLHLTRGSAADALKDFQALLKARPNDVKAMLGAAGALLALERDQEAIPLVREASERLGDHASVRLRKAQLAWRQGDRKAIAALRELLGVLPSEAPTIWRELLLAARRFGDRRLEAEAKKNLTP